MTYSCNLSNAVWEILALLLWEQLPKATLMDIPSNDSQHLASTQKMAVIGANWRKMHPTSEHQFSRSVGHCQPTFIAYPTSWQIHNSHHTFRKKFHLI